MSFIREAAKEAHEARTAVQRGKNWFLMKMSVLVR